MNGVPVVDLKKSKNPAAELIEAFRTIGFAYLEGHDVDPQLQSRLEKMADTFFKKPLSEKMKYEMKKSGMAWRGFFPAGGELTSGKPDQKEGFYFGVDHAPAHPQVVKKTPTFGANPWVDHEMKDTVTLYMSEMKRVGFLVMGLVAKGLDLPRDYFAKAFTQEPTEFFRIFGYPKHDFPPEADEWGVREHTDMGFLTILKQDNSGGLEARTVDGKWAQVPPRPNSFVLNIGDMLEFWTGGILRSTPHRVRNQAQQERFSYPYFFDPGWNSSLKPIDSKQLAKFAKTKSVAKRWDDLELHALSNDSTYGEFVWKKISHVFPGLATVKN